MRFTPLLIVVAVLLGVPQIWRVGLAEPGVKPSSERKMEIEVETYGADRTRDTRYAIPTVNGPVTVVEYEHNKAIRASDALAGFRTEANRNGGRSVIFGIVGTKHQSEYIDIDGDGLLDAMSLQNPGKLMIAVADQWIEVGDQKGGFEIGNIRTTVAKPRVSYIFKESAWVKE